MSKALHTHIRNFGENSPHPKPINCRPTFPMRDKTFKRLIFYSVGTVAAGKSSVGSDKGGQRAAKKCNEEETDSEDSPDGESDEEKREPAPKRSRGRLDCIQNTFLHNTQ